MEGTPNAGHPLPHMGVTAAGNVHARTGDKLPAGLCTSFAQTSGLLTCLTRVLSLLFSSPSTSVGLVYFLQLCALHCHLSCKAIVSVHLSHFKTVKCIL